VGGGEISGGTQPARHGGGFTRKTKKIYLKYGRNTGGKAGKRDETYINKSIIKEDLGPFWTNNSRKRET